MHLFYKRHIQVVVLLLIAALVVGACGGGDDEGSERRPTIPSFPTTTQTTTPQSTGTQVASAPTSTLLPTSSVPTPTRFAGFPTLSVPPTVPRTYPRQVQIVSPVTGQTLVGVTTIWGSASDPNFAQYTLEYGPDPNPSNLWYPITPSAVTVPVLNNVLGAWNTSLVPDGTYQIRIHLYLRDGRQETNVVVGNLRVANNVVVPTANTNNPPTISPIASLTLQRGTTTTVALGISDPDGDQTNFVATSDNTAIVSVTPSGQAITLLGISAGTATIRIRVIDSRGAQATTSFLVTVTEPVAPNNPPVVQPVPSQVINANTTLSVPLTITDPDGDAFTYTVQSASPTIASATANTATQSVNIAGFSPGTTTVTVIATDSRGLASSPMVFAVVVNPPLPDNNPPSIATIAGQTIEEGESKDIALSISDPDAGDTLSYTVQSSDTNIVQAQNIPNNSIRITGVNAGSATITVTVSDNRGATASTAFSVTVTEPPPPNQNPTIAAISDQTVEVGQTIEIDLQLSDPDGDSLTFSAIVADDTLLTTAQVDQDTMSITGVAEGSTTVTVNVGDGRGGSASTTFNVTITPATIPNQNPVLDPILDQTVEVGKTLVVGFNVSDPDSDPLTLFVSSSAPQVATVFQSGSDQLTLSGVSVGTATITIEVNDGRGGTAVQNFGVEVIPPNQNPVVDAVPDQTCVTAQNITVTVSFSDPDNDIITLTATSQQESIATVSLNIDQLTINCVAEGVATIVLEVSDDRGGVASTSFTVTVGSPNQDPVIAPITPITIEVGEEVIVTFNATDPDGDTLTVTPESDNTSVATVNLVQDGELRVVGIAEGTATITVNVSDGNGGAAAAAFGVTVTAPAPPPNQDPVIDPIAPVVLESGASTTITFNATDPDGDPLTASASSSDDSVASVGGITVGEITVIGGNAGNATITVTVEDGNGGSASTNFGVTVNAPAPVNQNPTVDAIAPVAIEVGQSLPVSFNASDPDGDPITATATSDNESVATVMVDSISQLTVTGVAEGNATITLTITDDKGGFASTTFGVAVSPPPPPPNQNPVLGDFAGVILEVGQSLPVAVSASDPDGDPITLTANVDNPTVASVVVDSLTQLTVSGLAAGNATVTVTVEDNQGGSVSKVFSVTVNEPAPPPNQNPVLGGIADVVIETGQVLPIAITASDPDGNPLTITTATNPEGIVNVSVDSLNQITITALTEGITTVTVTATDDQGGSASTTFTVTVNAPPPPPNQDPFIGPIAGITLEVGQSLPVAINPSDPDGNPITVTASSDNEGVAIVVVDSLTQLTVSGVAAGNAIITVNVTDDQGGSASTAFSVTVTEPAPVNQAPVFGVINPLTLEVGQSQPVTIDVNDPDGNPFTLNASSSDPNVASVTVDSSTQVTVTGVNVGSVTITLTADDGLGGIANSSFSVTVNAAAPPPAGPTLAGVPDVAALAPNLNNVFYNVGSTPPTAFSVAGDNTLGNDNFITPINNNAVNYGNYSNLQTTTSYYNFAIQSVAVGDNWTPASLLDPALADTTLCSAGETPLACELRLNTPSVLLISFSPSSATALDLPTFTSTMTTIVEQSLSSGTIPVLTLLWNDGIVTDQALIDQYNNAIIEVATNRASNPDLDIPVWDVGQTMQGQTQGFYAAAPSGPTDFSDSALVYGVNRRTLAALQILEAFRQAFP